MSTAAASSSGGCGHALDTDPFFRPGAPHCGSDVEDQPREVALSPRPRRRCIRIRLGTAVVTAALLVGCVFGAARSRSSRQPGRSPFVGLSAAAPANTTTTEPPPPSGKNVLAEAIELLPWDQAVRKARAVEARLTDEERASLLHGGGFLVVNNWVGIITAIPRLGVPALKLQDSSNGFRPTAPGEYGTSTSWPSSLALAASWDEDMVRRLARAIAREFRGKGANVILGPGVNLHRTPYGGRNFEYLSGEDPYLGSRLAAAYVKAVQAEGVMAVVKHFAFNEQETDRDFENSIISERASWELYYPPFEAAVRAGAGAVMCSYNRVNGTHACNNDKILLRDLKGKMGFDGFVMSDWKAAHSTKDVESGLDMEQPSAKYFQRGRLADVSRKAVQEAARRVLASIYHLRLDENPGCALPCDAARKSNQRTPEHLKLAEEAATGSVVLLKNDGVLPLDPKRFRTMAVLGPAAKARDTMNTWGPGSPYSGGGSGHVAAPYVVTPLQGIKERAHRAGMRILDDGSDTPEPEDSGGTPADAVSELDLDVSDSAEAGAKTPVVPEPPQVYSKAMLQSLRVAEQADIVVAVAACTTTESKDRPSLALDDGANELIQALVDLGKPVVVLMEVPGSVLTPWRDGVAAAACLFYGGEVTGRAWASVLFGDVSPTGKLPIALPASEEGAIKPGTPEVPYTEDIFTSYRSASLKAAFPFGFGLTYTAFHLGQPIQVVDACPTPACVEMMVRNVGQRAGSEVIQAYLVFDPLLKGPALALRGFRRTRLLQPGDSELVRFAFTARDLSSYVVGEGWRHQQWAVVRLGTSSKEQDLRLKTVVKACPWGC